LLGTALTSTSRSLADVRIERMTVASSSKEPGQSCAPGRLSAPGSARLAPWSGSTRWLATM
jgi:hypothetical protein